MGFGRRTLYASLLAKQAIANQVPPQLAPTAQQNEVPTFVLLGGELFNKGAQAMTFTVVDRLNREFPNCEIYLFSTKDYLADYQEQYKFDFLPWDIDIQLELLGYRGQKFKEQNWNEEILRQVRDVFGNATAILDISGYSLSSQLGVDSVIRYMTDVALASRYDVPYYILPQSIGPFEFGTVGKISAGTLLRAFLPYPDLICPREEEGLKAVSQYTTKNVQLERDLVLQCPEYDICNISESIVTKTPDIEKKAVGIIPNKNVLQYAESDMIEIYHNIINQLKKEYNTYILRHAADDEQLCQQLYAPFENDLHVHNLNQDYNAIQLQNIITQFEFTVASRYHSVVHSYRSSVPAIIIGWATKYKELAQFFDQENYQYDCRGTVNESSLLFALSEMSKSTEYEKNKIEHQFNSLQEGEDILSDVFRMVSVQHE